MSTLIRVVGVVLMGAAVAPAAEINLLNSPGGLYSTGIPGSSYAYQFVPGSPPVWQSTTGLASFAATAYPISGTAATGTPGSFPLTAYWSGNAPGSQWILTRGNGGVNGDFSDLNGRFLFTTSFTAPNGVLDSEIVGQVAADNRIEAILLNGHDTGFLGGPLSSPSNGFPFTPFRISGGVQSGSNELTFVVWNQPQAGGNPVGLNVNFSQAFVRTPEPGTLAILGATLGLAGWRARRRRAG